MTTKNVVIKDQHAFMVEVLEKLGTGTTYLKIIKDMYNKHISNILLWETFSISFKICTKDAIVGTLSQYSTWSLN